MRPLHSVHPVGVALAATLFGCHSPGHPMETSPAASPLAQSGAGVLVTEGVLRVDPNRGIKGERKFFYVPATIQGHQVSLILDTGAPTMITAATLDSVGVQHTADSLGMSIGSHLERVDGGGGGFVDSKDTPSGLPPVAGIFGPPQLQHYDIVFDYPAGRVRFYTPSGRPWLLAGLTPADCTPIRDPKYTDAIELPVMINGHSVPGVFDAGSRYIVMNVAAAKLAGITKHTPHLQNVPNDQIDIYGNGVISTWEYEVPGIPVAMGALGLSAIPVRVLAHLSLPDPAKADDPNVIVGIEAIRDRILVLSYHDKQLCLSAPRSSPGG